MDNQNDDGEEKCEPTSDLVLCEEEENLPNGSAPYILDYIKYAKTSKQVAEEIEQSSTIFRHIQTKYNMTVSYGTVGTGTFVFGSNSLQPTPAIEVGSTLSSYSLPSSSSSSSSPSSSSSLSPTSATETFHDKQLGLTIIDQCPVKVGTAFETHTGLVPSGAAIVGIGDISTTAVTMKTFLHILRDASRPIELKFDWSKKWIELEHV